jgi:hypothetical protein
MMKMAFVTVVSNYHPGILKITRGLNLIYVAKVEVF